VSDRFPIRNGLKQGEVISPLLFNFALEHAISGVQVNFKYLGTTLTNQNSIVEEMKSRLRSGNSCYHSVQNLLSFQVAIQKFKV